MAVVQISKIQIRRDVKDATKTADLPIKLATGELAWCIDTKQLYIGTHAIGDPSITENVEILSEDSDIFNLGQYSYKKGIITTGVSGDITRSVQSRLDDKVNAYSFGVRGVDGLDNDSEAINRAIVKLYKNSLQNSGSPDLRAVLEFGPGIYTIEDPIYIYSYTKIVGSGAGSTIFRYQPNDPTLPAFIFVDDNNNPSTIEELNQCRNVVLKDFTLEVNGANTIAMDLFCLRDSEFRNIEVKSTWSAQSTGTNSIGVSMRVKSDLITCKNNEFVNVLISKFRYGINAKGDIINNIVRDSTFSFCEIGINLGNDPTTPTGTLDITQNILGEKFGPRNTVITTCNFNDIQKQAIKIWQGKGNLSSKNKFKFVGNNFGGNIEAAYSQIEIDVPNNLSRDDYSDRHLDLANLGAGGVSAVPYISEISGKSFYENPYTNLLPMSYSSNSQELFRFPIPISSTANIGPNSCCIEIEYLYQSRGTDNTGTRLNYRRIRKGTLTLVVDSRNFNLDSVPDLNLTDDYDYLGHGLETPDPTDEDVFFMFQGDLVKTNNRWQVKISYKYNVPIATPSYELGTLTYTYRFLS